MSRTSKLQAAGVALFALLFLVLQPVCAAYGRPIGALHVASIATAHVIGQADAESHGSRDGTLCCPEMSADAMTSVSPVVADKNFSAAELILFLPVGIVARPALTLLSHPARDNPPPQPLSYHARSARILR